MRRGWTIPIVTALTLLVLPAAVADDVSDAEKLICSSVEATVCTLEGGCEIGAPWFWGIPQFVEIDLKAERLSTTAASGQDRETPITRVERENGRIYLQGVEQGRAFSFVIHEETGFLTVAVAREEMTVSVFGACTPLAR